MAFQLDTSGEERSALIALVGGAASFVSSFNARTFSPERRAQSGLDDGASLWRRGAEAVRAAGGDENLVAEWVERFKRKWSAYQTAGARTLNWMITGPARFPVESNRRRMDTEHKRAEEMLAHVTGAADWTRRRLASAARAAASETAKTAVGGLKETAFPGGRIVFNTAIDRVQLVFASRPDAETIAHLKSRAFRWSPREGAWQRQLTQNGVRAAEAIAKAEGAA